MFGTLAPTCSESCHQGQYQEVFCGTCHALAELGRPWALATGYDIAFLHAVVAALENTEAEKLACTALPFHKLKVRRVSKENRDWIVAVYLLLLGEKCRDDIADDGGFRGKLGLRVLRSHEEGSLRRLQRSGFCTTVLLELSKTQRELERKPGLALESYARPTTHLMGEVFAHLAVITNRPDQSGHLRHLGQALGHLIYLKDAVDDLEKDRQNGRFNAVLSASNGAHVKQIRFREYSRLLYGLSGLSVSASDHQMLLSVLKSLSPEQAHRGASKVPLVSRLKRRSSRGVCEALLCCGPEVCLPACGEACAPVMGEACCYGCAGCPSDCCVLSSQAQGSSAAMPAKPPPPPLPCPACSNNLLTQTYEGVEIDECRVCNGLWLDKGELELLGEHSYYLPDRLLTQKSTTGLQLRPEGTRPCPRCGVLLTGTLVKGVHLDICTDCQGIWLDQGELNRLLS